MMRALFVPVPDPFLSVRGEACEKIHKLPCHGFYNTIKSIALVNPCPLPQAFNPGVSRQID
jgi:hypothetical protein